MIPKINGQAIQLRISVPAYKYIYKKKLFKTEKITVPNGDIAINVWSNIYDICCYGNLIENEQVSKTKCRIFNMQTGEYSIVEHSLEELEEVLHKNKVGYKTNKDEV